MIVNIELIMQKYYPLSFADSTITCSTGCVSITREQKTCKRMQKRVIQEDKNDMEKQREMGCEQSRKNYKCMRRQWGIKQNKTTRVRGRGTCLRGESHTTYFVPSCQKVSSIYTDLPQSLLPFVFVSFLI